MNSFEPLSRSLTGSTFALTTAFIPPASCSDIPLVGVPLTEFTTYPSPPTFGEELDECIPPLFSEADYGTYSPGMCPSGYTTWASAVSGDFTSAHCCPTALGGGWTGFGRFCGKSVLNRPTGVVVASGKSASVTVTVATYFVESIGFHVMYQQKDLSLFPADYTPGVAYPTALATSTTSSTLGTAFSSATSSPTGPATSTRVSKPSGLSAGTKAGIGIGVALGAIFVLLLVWWAFRKRRQNLNREKSTRHAYGPELHGDDVKEISGEEVKRNQLESSATELDAPKSVPTHAELKGSGVQNSNHEIETQRTYPPELSSTPQMTRASPGAALSSRPMELDTARSPHSTIPEADKSLTNAYELHSEPQGAAFNTNISPPVQSATFDSSKAGPVADHLFEGYDVEDSAAEKETQAQMPEGRNTQLTAQELEIQWLEREEARIRERKEQLKSVLSK